MATQLARFPKYSKNLIGILVFNEVDHPAFVPPKYINSPQNGFWILHPTLLLLIILIVHCFPFIKVFYNQLNAYFPQISYTISITLR